MGMFDGTSFPAVCFLSAETPLTRRLLVYFRSGAYSFWFSLARSAKSSWGGSL
jgi:hypothetical protein